MKQSHTQQTLAQVLDVAPRLSFRAPALEVVNEVAGVLAVWRCDDLLHVEATDDLAFEVHLIRHGLNGRSRFLSRLFDQVIWPAVSAEGSWWPGGGPDAATRSLVQDQLTYSLQVISIDVTAIDTCSRELRDQMCPVSLGGIAWDDGWSLPHDAMA